MKSILQDKREERCYICRHWQQAPEAPRMRYDKFGNIHPELDEHHIFEGINRKASEKYGLKVYLCKYHHTGGRAGSRDAVHSTPNAGFDLKLKRRAQYAWEKRFSKYALESEDANEEFREIFGRNYL